VYWVVGNNMYSEENFENLLTTLKRLDLPHSVHCVRPFVGDLDPELPTPDGNIIVMGSYTLARIAKRRGWYPGAFLDDLDYREHCARWGDAMLNYDATYSGFGYISERREPFFIRPTEDTKAFTGEVTDWPSYVEWRDRVLALTPEDNPTVTKDTRVVVSSKKEIYNETRTWIIDKRVVTCSGYKVGTIKRYSPPETVDPRIIKFAEDHARWWSPNRAYVMDIADTPNGLKIVEINNLNSAGWYRCDMQKLIMALEDMPFPEVAQHVEEP